MAPLLGHNIPRALAAVTLASGYDEQAGAGAASIAASFLTLATDPALSAERVLTPDSTLAGSDGGAGCAYALGVNQGYAFTWTSLHTFSAGVRIAAGQALQFGTDAQIDRKSADTLEIGVGDSLESPGFSGGTAGWHVDSNGNAEFNSITARGELRASTFVIQEVHAMGGSMVILPAAELKTQVTTA